MTFARLPSLGPALLRGTRGVCLQGEVRLSALLRRPFRFEQRYAEGFEEEGYEDLSDLMARLAIRIVAASPNQSRTMSRLPARQRHAP